MKLSTLQVLDLAGYAPMNATSALDDLHGVKVPIMKDGSAAFDPAGKLMLDVKPYVFSGGVRIQLALLRKKLAPIVEVFQAEHQKLVGKYVHEAPDKAPVI